MGRVRKVVLTVVGLLLALVIVVVCHDTWADWQYKHHGGWEAAGMEPIPGAELVFYKYEPNGFLSDFETTWTYKLPTGYTEKIYRNCSAMHYKTGALLGYEKDGTENIDPKIPGCRHDLWLSHEVISIQFAGDQLTIQDIYGF